MDSSQPQHSTDTPASNEDPVESMDPPPPSQSSADFYFTRGRPPGTNENPLESANPPPSQPPAELYGTWDFPVDLTGDSSQYGPSTSARTSGTRDPGRDIETDPNPPQPQSQPSTHGGSGARLGPGIDRVTHPQSSQQQWTEMPRSWDPSAELPALSPSQYFISYHLPNLRQHWLENESKFVFKAFLPNGVDTKGFTKEFLADRILFINGEGSMMAPDDSQNDILGWKIRRSYLLRLDLSIKVPENVVLEAVGVKLGIGIITVTLPKRRIQILQLPLEKPFMSL